jgi:hypothetical protein
VLLFRISLFLFLALGLVGRGLSSVKANILLMFERRVKSWVKSFCLDDETIASGCSNVNPS